MKSSHHIVETVGQLACSAEAAWNKVCFYEHIETKPSWFLRTVLPTPLRTTGCYGKVGDSSRCLYSDGGYLAKKITKLVEGECIEFDIIEHSIRYCRDIALRGGTIRIAAHEDGSCSVHMVTRYELLTPRWRIARYFVARTISAMHRIVMKDMRERLCVRPQSHAEMEQGCVKDRLQVRRRARVPAARNPFSLPSSG